MVLKTISPGCGVRASLMLFSVFFFEIIFLPAATDRQDQEAQIVRVGVWLRPRGLLGVRLHRRLLAMQATQKATVEATGDLRGEQEDSCCI